MKKFNLKSGLLFAALALALVSGLFATPASAQTGDLTVDWGVPEGDPIFVVTNMAPGDMESRDVGLSNGALSPYSAGVRGIKTSETGSVSDVLDIEIKEGATTLYGPKTLSQFFTESEGPNEIPLSTINAGAATTYTFKITFQPSAGNEFLETRVDFDIVIGGSVSSDNVIASATLFPSPEQIAAAPAVDKGFIKDWAVEISVYMNDPVTKGTFSLLTAATAVGCLAPEVLITKPFCIVGTLTLWVAKEKLWDSVDALAGDPPRQDFDLKEHVKPAKPIKPFNNSAYASTAARYATSLARQAQLYDATRITYERLQGAIIADKGEFMLLQSETLRDFLTRLAEGTEHHREVTEQLARQLNYAWNEETNQLLIRWAEEGLSEEERQALLAGGVSETDIVRLEEILQSVAQGQNNLSFLNDALKMEADLTEQILSRIQKSLNVLDGIIAELEILVCGQNGSKTEACLGD